MTGTTAIDRLALFISSHPKGGMEPRHLARASEAFLDTIGCMILGADAPATQSALTASLTWGHGPARIPGIGATLPVPWAALVGGAAAHAYDLDDYTLVANDHPSAVMVPALLAYSSTNPSLISGADLLDAYLIGLEVIFRCGAAVNMGHYNRGWHTTSTLDSLGATAAIARLMGLNTTQTAAALSLTTSLGSGFVSQFGTMAKPLHAGISAKAGIVACALARAGATASPNVLDGPVSLATIMSPHDVPGFDAALEGLGETWGLDRFGLGNKLYPSCGYTHRSIDGALRLHQRLAPLDINTIASVALSLPDFHLAILPYGVPETRDEALFSAPWCAAVALATGQCTSADFTSEGLNRPAILALAAKTRTQARPPMNPAINLDANDPDIVTVALTNGQVFEEKVDLWTGAPGRDMGRDQVVQKFAENCRKMNVSEHDLKSLASAVLDLPNCSDVVQLFDKMHPRNSSSARTENTANGAARTLAT